MKLSEPVKWVVGTALVAAIFFLPWQFIVAAFGILFAAHFIATTFCLFGDP
jgi:hypothetical protein